MTSWLVCSYRGDRSPHDNIPSTLSARSCCARMKPAVKIRHIFLISVISRMAGRSPVLFRTQEGHQYYSGHRKVTSIIQDAGRSPVLLRTQEGHQYYSGRRKVTSITQDAGRSPVLLRTQEGHQYYSGRRKVTSITQDAGRSPVLLRTQA